MEVRELIAQLETLPQDARVDIVFPDADAYGVTAVDVATITGGVQVAVLYAEDDTPAPGPVAA